MELVEFLHDLARNQPGWCKGTGESELHGSYEYSPEANVLYRAIYALEFDVPLDENALQQLCRMYQEHVACYCKGEGECWKQSALSLQAVIVFLQTNNQL